MSALNVSALLRTSVPCKIPRSSTFLHVRVCSPLHHCVRTEGEAERGGRVFIRGKPQLYTQPDPELSRRLCRWMSINYYPTHARTHARTHTDPQSRFPMQHSNFRILKPNKAQCLFGPCFIYNIFLYTYAFTYLAAYLPTYLPTYLPIYLERIIEVF